MNNHDRRTHPEKTWDETPQVKKRARGRTSQLGKHNRRRECLDSDFVAIVRASDKWSKPIQSG